MNYCENSHVRTADDVKAFFHHLVYERKVNFHPDDDFAEYISHEDKSPSFSAGEVNLYNRLMKESFDVCENAKVDIYEIGLNELRTAFMA